MRNLYKVPTPGHPLAIPTEEDFIVWCESPVTQFVALAYKTAAEAQKEAWTNQTWENGNFLEEKTLIELRTRYDGYKAFLEAEYQDYLALVKTKSPLK